MDWSQRGLSWRDVCFLQEGKKWPLKRTTCLHAIMCLRLNAEDAIHIHGVKCLQAMVVASMLMIPECALILCNHEGWQKFSAINHCGTVNCNNHYYTWCPPTSFPLFRTLPPGPSILQIKAHSFSGSLFRCELSNVHLHITENLALFPMEVVEQQMGGQAKGLTYLLREVILCIFLWNTWDERVFFDKLWNNKIQ